MTIKLSKAGKMPCKSWSLQAIETCPGSVGSDGELVDACKGCYATTGNYRFPNVKAPRIHNREDWKRAGWEADMIEALEGETYFRWFDSGDMYDVRLANKIYRIMEATPSTKHWLPTRQYKFDKFKRIIGKMQRLSNVVVRLSSDSVEGKTIPGRNISTIAPSSRAYQVTRKLHKAVVCEAYSRDGKCGDCRACWDRDVKTVLYPAHGVKMNNLIAKSA